MMRLVAVRLPGMVLLVALAFACLGPRAHAQDGERAKKPDRLVRLLPVGEAPPFRQVIEDGVRKELPPPPGSVPPFSVVQLTPEGAEEGQPLRLRLDRLSGSMPVRPGSLALHETGPDGLNPNAWHTLRIPNQSTHALAILWRDPEEKSWDKAQSMTLPDDVKAFPAGSVRIVNVSPWPVGIDFDGQAGQLPPGKVLLKPARRGVLKNAPLKVAFKGKDGRWMPVFHQSLNQAGGERTNVVIYRADGEKPRRPVKVRVIAEPARLPAPPKE